jgi:S-DNA-T family DNA segregation ATPase FtsK/SpoIIIE
MIVVDPKRRAQGLRRDPPPADSVITDASIATNALRNAVLEMERRLKLLASHGVRNIEQFNRKAESVASQPHQLRLDCSLTGEHVRDPRPPVPRPPG